MIGQNTSGVLVQYAERLGKPIQPPENFKSDYAVKVNPGYVVVASGTTTFGSLT